MTFIKMKNILSVFVTVFALSSASSAFAKCYGPKDKVTLEGVLTTKATYIDPNDFGWAPKNGYQPYDVIVLSEPICYEAESVSGEEGELDIARDV